MHAITMKTIKHILTATDFTAPSERAVRVATELATTYKASLTILYVFENPRGLYTNTALYSDDMVEPVLEDAESRLSELLSSISKEISEATARIRQGNPHEEILSAARESGVDLIVIGTHGRTGIARAVLGSVAEKVVRLSPVPVLTVRQSEEQTTVVAKVKSKTKEAAAAQ